MTICDPDSGTLVECESIWDGRRLPWARDDDPAFAGAGAMQGLRGNPNSPFERKYTPRPRVVVPPRRCAVCGQMFKKPPKQSREFFSKRQFCSQRCGAQRHRRPPVPSAAAIQADRHHLTIGQLAQKHGVEKADVRAVLRLVPAPERRRTIVIRATVIPPPRGVR